MAWEWVVQDKGNGDNGFVSHCSIAGYKVNTVCWVSRRNKV
jgi:hypothetical protein